MVKFTIPYAYDKNLGFAYNSDVVSADSEWVGLCDRDTIFHHSDFGHKVSAVVKEHGDGVYTSLTGRTNCSWQRLVVNITNDIEYHRQVAEHQWEKWGTHVEEHTNSQLMSGHLIVVKKELWTPIEKTGILGIDNLVHQYAKDKGIPVYLMKGVYQYHYYSNFDGVGGHQKRDKSHLK